MAKFTQIVEIELNKLVPSKFNVRKELGDISELVESIKGVGVLQPIVVRPKANKYEVIIGSRRVAAAKEAGLRKIPAFVGQIDDQEALLESLTENLQRNNLEPKELGEAIEILTRDFGLTQQRVAQKLGIAERRVSQISTAYKLLLELERSGRRVEFYPKKEERETGKAVPFEHTYLVASALENPEVKQVLSRLPEEKVEEKKFKLIEAIAPLPEEKARKVVDEFKMYPERPVEETKKRALVEETGVALETYLRPSVARKLREIAEKEDKTIEEVAVDLVEKSLMTKERVEERGVPQHWAEGLATDPPQKQMAKWWMWNLQRISFKPDFFTTHYALKDIETFIETLKVNRVRTLIDIRHDPVSQFRPEFNRNNLERVLKKEGINYLHVPQLGVPRDVRDKLAKTGDWKSFFRWYDENVLPNLDSMINSGKLNEQDKPYAFMCVELDPEKCHRHRIAIALEEKGLRSLDI